jgi:hypothetical protein
MSTLITSRRALESGNKAPANATLLGNRMQRGACDHQIKCTRHMRPNKTNAPRMQCAVMRVLVYTKPSSVYGPISLYVPASVDTSDSYCLWGQIEPHSLLWLRGRDIYGFGVLAIPGNRKLGVVGIFRLLLYRPDVGTRFSPGVQRRLGA